MSLTGVVAGSASCCPVGSTLDNVGECCPPGKQLDACGTCGGPGKAVDLLGRCCLGELDASGLCCPPPLTVDEFGVCGGVSDSGSLVWTLQTTAGDLLSRLCLTMDCFCAGWRLRVDLEVCYVQVKMPVASQLSFRLIHACWQMLWMCQEDSCLSSTAPRTSLGAA